MTIQDLNNDFSLDSDLDGLDLNDIVLEGGDLDEGNPDGFGGSSYEVADEDDDEDALEGGDLDEGNPDGYARY